MNTKSHPHLSLVRLLTLALGSFLTLLLVACGLSPSGLCHAIIRNSCAKAHECTQDSQKNDIWKASNGKDVQECIDIRNNGKTIDLGLGKLELPGQHCDQFTKENACSKENSKVYHPEQAQQCMNDWANTKCSDLKTFYSPESCKIICQDT